MPMVREGNELVFVPKEELEEYYYLRAYSNWLDGIDSEEE